MWKAERIPKNHLPLSRHLTEQPTFLAVDFPDTRARSNCRSGERRWGNIPHTLSRMIPRPEVGSYGERGEITDLNITYKLPSLSSNLKLPYFH